MKNSFFFLIIIKKNKRTGHLVNFAVPDGKQKNKTKKIDKYLDLAKGPKKLLNMWMKVTPIVVDALEIVPKGFERRLEELVIREKKSRPSKPHHC